MHIFHHSPTHYRNNGLRSWSRQSVSIRVGDLSIHGPACQGPCPGTDSLGQFIRANLLRLSQKLMCKNVPGSRLQQRAQQPLRTAAGMCWERSFSSL